MRDTVKKLWRWSLCLNVRERTVKDAAERLQMSMRTTVSNQFRNVRYLRKLEMSSLD